MMGGDIKAIFTSVAGARVDRCLYTLFLAQIHPNGRWHHPSWPTNPAAREDIEPLH
jgi:hypothetical protein